MEGPEVAEIDGPVAGGVGASTAAGREDASREEKQVPTPEGPTGPAGAVRLRLTVRTVPPGKRDDRSTRICEDDTCSSKESTTDPYAGLCPCTSR